MSLVLDEPDWERIGQVLSDSMLNRVSAGNWIELSAVLTRRGDPALDARFARMVRNLRLQVAPVTVEQAHIGHDAYRRYGRGSGHAAYLNFGDCFAYALSRDSGEPLLFKGDDFVHTDVERVAY